MNIYVSTSCLGFNKKVSDILKIYQNNGFKNIELGSSHIYEKGIEDYLAGLNHNFIIHNLFPAPKIKLIMNLASSDKKILTLSREQAKKSIDFCQKIKSPLYSFHAGFRVDPENLSIEKGIERKNIAPYALSFALFVDSVKEILEYAKTRKIKVAVEPNVLAELNIANGKNELLLLCEYWEIEELFKRVNSDNLGILLDLGHLKITSQSLNFDKDDFVDKVKDKVFEIHIHDNDSKKDLHLGINKESWALTVLDNFKNIPICLESGYSSIEDLKKDYHILNQL